MPCSVIFKNYWKEKQVRKDRIPMTDGDEVDVFRMAAWYRSVNDSGFRKSKKAINRRYIKRLRRAGKEECK